MMSTDIILDSFLSNLINIAYLIVYWERDNKKNPQDYHSIWIEFDGWWHPETQTGINLSHLEVIKTITISEQTQYIYKKYQTYWNTHTNKQIKNSDDNIK